MSATSSPSSWSVSTGVRKDEREILAGRSAQPGAGRAHRRRGAGRLRLASVTGAPTASSQDTLSKTGRPRGQRAHRHRRRLSLQRTLPRRCAKSRTATSGPAAGSAPNYLYSERTSLYLNYALENERTDNGLRGRAGQPDLGHEAAPVGQRAASISRSATRRRDSTYGPDARDRA